MNEQVLKVSNISKKYEIPLNNEKSDTFATVLLKSLWAGKRKKMTSEKNELWALKDINFTVNKGDRIGIIGHNGAGKSTLLKVFSRITTPTEGKIEVNGRISSLLEVGTGFHPELTGRENIYLNGSILGMSRNEIEKKFADIVEFSEIKDFLDTPVKKYSSGMYVKLAFAVAAHLDPDILIVDEVLAVGDMKFQQKCLGKMEDVSGEGRTVLYVSHNMNTVQQLCNRVIVMDHGKIIFDGNVEDGIQVYMNNNKKMEIFNNLDKTERPKDVNLNGKIVMNTVQLINKNNPLYNNEEKVLFELGWTAKKDLKDVYLRIIVQYSDDTPAGMGTTVTSFSTQQGKIGKSLFEFDNTNLAPGTYLVKLVLYTVNEFGTDELIDVVPSAFVFEMKDSRASFNNLDWTHRYWGHTRFNNIEIIDSSVLA
ncbi:ABC transporter ATP-binding protein [Neobacillus ginsengisoli]|uniref:Lipopolysaccharide transport system ATP-binding protein n=1 Tax=Neobacillus ginsengisoli TaxID=904295 RepID=A0ABT9XT83_9BACI|nr:polysaccharide ABC transporter ATP-binding protein [Neobacillus ginsengisoli]MDQ0198771.1 lipopolysaccharide transport system ATP-binding protein [Neobacillus ginsengisoli]